MRAAVAMVALCSHGAVQAQSTADSSAKPAMMAKDADPDWEVVRVRPSDPNGTYQSFHVEGRHVMIDRKTVEAMLMVAYSLQKNQIVNVPDWVKTESFDADGVPDTEGQPSVPQFQVMVRKLLEQRFGLKAHKEQRKMEVYALRVGKEGAKLTPTKSDPNKQPGEVHDGTVERILQFTNVSMGDFVVMMLFEGQRPMVDQTGLKGRYDFNLKYTREEQAAATDGSAPPNLFTAIQEQIGLKLEPVRAMADVLVVDKVERPGAN